MNEVGLNMTTPELLIGDLSILSTMVTQASPTESAPAPSEGSIMESLVYSCFGLLVCSGNGVTFLAIWKSPRLNSLADFYIASLAVADFVVGVTFIITALTGLREVGKVFRENQYACLAYLNMIVIALTASLLTLVFLSVDRCMCVLNPLKYMKRKKKLTHSLLIALVWILSFAYAAIPYIQSGHFKPGVICMATIQHPKWYILYAHPLMGTSCFAAVAVCYIIIAWKHFQQTKRWGRKSDKSTSSGHREYNIHGETDGTALSIDTAIEKICNGEDVATVRKEPQTPPNDKNHEGGEDKDSDDRSGDDHENKKARASYVDQRERFRRNLSEVSDTNEVNSSNPKTVETHASKGSGEMRSSATTRGDTAASLAKSTQANSHSSAVAMTNQALSRQSVRLVKMTFIILVVFFICWFPGNIIIIVSAFTPVDSSIQMMFLVLTFLNSGLNVVIYVTMNRRYREAVMAVLCCPYRNRK